MVIDNRAVELIFRNPKRDPPLRIKRWVLRLAEYRFTIVHKPGAQNIAEYLSRQPVGEPATNITDESEEIVALISYHATPKAITREKIASATSNDIHLREVIKLIRGECTTIG